MRRPSNRSFGVTFALVFGLLAGWPTLGGGRLRWWALLVAALFFAAAILRPQALSPLNHAWSSFGLVLHRVTSPIVLGVVFFGVLTPLALLMRALGRDALRLRRAPEAPTYWIGRHPPGPAPGTMSRQF